MKVSAHGLMLTASCLAKINQQGTPETKHDWWWNLDASYHTPGTQMDSMI
jgi:hypothetical protein